MRSVLFTIPLDGELNLGPLGKLPVFGLGLMLAAWALFGIFVLVATVRRFGWKGLPFSAVLVWGGIAVAIHEIPRFVQAIPVYGYGTMLFVGFLVAAWVASTRIQNLGYDGEIAWDAAMWIFISGIIGARAFYVIQYHERFFIPGRSVGEVLKALVNLPDGGIVFYGGVITGAVAYYVFCRRRHIRPLALADIVVTSVLIGMTFGRIGCLLHGCCYGDVCSLPWAVTFPPDSVPFTSEIQRGFLTADASGSLPLHPTQIYSSLNAFMLVLVTWAYYPFRHKDGAVLAVAWVAYPLHRFVVELLRGDEIGQFGTSLTISQWVSLALVGSGVAFLCWLHTRPKTLQTLVAPVS